MKGLDNNEEAKNLVENFKGSTENRMRSLYNLGYWQGFNDGQREAVQMLERALMDMTAEQTEPNCSEKANNSTISKMEQVDKDINARCKEPQTIGCPKCGRTDYIRDMEKDFGIKGSSYKYKCINCNTYIKDEP